MPADFQFAHHLPFTPAGAAEILRQIPTLPGVCALRGERETDQPYLTRAADLRRRLTRLLAPPEPSADGAVQSKRLNLRDRVHSIAWTVTGSEFESLLLLYDASAALFTPAEARRRLRLHTPYFLRLTLEHEHPRVYSTNRLSRRALPSLYGPFPSRAQAERYCDAVLDLFKLRRCYEDLEVHPAHPGCAYGEMKKCMAPCNAACTPAQYAAEATAVEAFFLTHGESLLARIAADRDRASADMEFEAAAAAHERYTRVKAAAALADELIRPATALRAIIVQRAAATAQGEAAQQAAVFLLEAGCLHGPAPLSTLGVRAVKEQTSVGSSLFAQPLMLQAVPLDQGQITPGASREPSREPSPEASPASSPASSPEARAEAVLKLLEQRAQPLTDTAILSDHLSLLRRWYYRPEKQRAGEIFLPNPDGSWPLRRILRGAARIALGDPRPMAETNREAAPQAAAELKTKILHEGREGIERTVPAAPRHTRRAQVPAPS